MLPTLNKDHLDEFVDWVDNHGGPDSETVKSQWAGIRYCPATVVDQTQDPFSDFYWAQQVELYREISGRELNQYTNELAHFTVEDYIAGPNPYGSKDPARMVVHYGRLAKLIKHADLPNSARILDLGCGWGLSSEFFATLGCRVKAVDINESFVDLVRRRSHRLNFEIEVMQSNFDDLQLDEKFDMIVFYECLHHALRPVELLSRLAGWLAPNGKVGLAGEPIQNIWWNSWGLRLDPLSIYCIRKFGWFESGWSKDFIKAAFERCGLSADYIDDPDSDVGPIVVASYRNIVVPKILEEPSPAFKKTLENKIAARLDLLRRGISLVRQALSLSFLFRKK